jgi:hypothetical protein
VRATAIRLSLIKAVQLLVGRRAESPETTVRINIATILLIALPFIHQKPADCDLPLTIGNDREMHSSPAAYVLGIWQSPTLVRSQVCCPVNAAAVVSLRAIFRNFNETNPNGIPSP